MDVHPAFSVVMPVRNGAAYLRPALESIGRQSRGDFEAIVVDDGSTDGTAEILAGWARCDRRFRIIRHPENLNVACARNTGLAAAACALVLQADADDINHPDRFAAQLDAAVLHPEMAIIGSDLRLGSRSRWRYPRDAEAIRARMLWACPFAQNTVLLNRTVLGDVRYNPAFPICEDTELWLRCVFRHPTMNLPAALVTYCVHPGSLSGDLSERRLRIEREIMARRSALLGCELDVDAGIASYLGNRIVPAGAARIAAHVERTSRFALARRLVDAMALRRESRRQLYRMGRNYGRRPLRREWFQVARAALASGWKLGRLSSRGARPVPPRY